MAPGSAAAALLFSTAWAASDQAGLAQAGGFAVVAHRPEAATWRRTQCGGPSGSADIPSRWASEVSAASTPLPAYPRPRLVRTSGGLGARTLLRDQGDSSTWQNLNGLWEWAPATSPATPPFGQKLDKSILVPFPVEACLSGVAPQRSADFVKSMWYRLKFDAAVASGRTLLHFGAVDWQTTVYLNGAVLGNHTGGYDGFSFDLSGRLLPKGNELLVYVYDPTDDFVQPNGKQRISAIDDPHGDTYTPSSGIWQTVWLENVPKSYIHDVQVDQASTSSVTITAVMDGAVDGQMVHFAVLDAGKQVTSASGPAGTPVTIPIPGAKLWSPDTPHLYDVKVTAGEDSVLSYFGLRTLTTSVGQEVVVPAGPYMSGIDRPGNDMEPCGGAGCVLAKSAAASDCEAKCRATTGCVAYVWASADCSGKTGPLCWLKSAVSGGGAATCRDSQVLEHSAWNTRLVLNGQPTFLAGFLDQSWWPDGQYTAPTDAALESDLLATKAFGMNLIRLHQKVNPERWYYFADKHGLIIFQDMIQKLAGGAQEGTVPFFVDDLKSMIAGRKSHPCIVQWTAFNEGDCWNVFKTPPYDVNGITQLIKQLDPTRLVDTDSGGGANDYHIADVNDIHTYPNPGDPQPSKSQYAMIGEYGGTGAFIAGKAWVPGKCWTYEQVPSATAEACRYILMAKTLASQADHLSVSVFTQVTDVELECDGFLNYDRSNKFTEAETSALQATNDVLIHAGPSGNATAAVDAIWRKLGCASTQSVYV